MKLIEYNSENTANTEPKFPRVRVGKSGLFSFNGEAQALLELTDESSVIICNDEDSPRDFYIRKTELPNAFKLRGKGSQKFLMFNCAKVEKMILYSAKSEGGESFRISKEKIEMGGGTYFLIITAAPNAK
jgi:hypothetical protein